MVLQFTIRQVMILIADLAILSAVAAMLFREDGTDNRLLFSMLFLMFPFSLAFALRIFDRAGPRRRLLEESLVLSWSFFLFAWWLWFDNVFLDRTTRDQRHRFGIVFTIYLSVMMVLSVVAWPPLREKWIVLLRRWSRKA
jgi:hypothetical protein